MPRYNGRYVGVSNPFWLPTDGDFMLSCLYSSLTCSIQSIVETCTSRSMYGQVLINVPRFTNPGTELYVFNRTSTSRVGYFISDLFGL